MTNPTPHGQVPEALRLANVCSNLTRYSMDAHLIAAELRRQNTRIAELEAQIEALSGVQALSAAPAVPAGWKLVPVEPTRSMMAAAVIFANGNAVYKNVSATALEIEERIYGEAYSAMLAASPTPPAEQQATSDPLDWPLPCDITAGCVTISKGCPLRTVQTRLKVQAEANARLMRHLSREQAAPKAAPGEPYQDSTPHLSVGDSSFESWFGSYCPANKGDKQRARDAYAAGMGDPLVRAAPQQEAQEPCPTCAALARTVMLDQVSFDRKPDCYGIRQITDDEGVEEWEDIRTSPDVAREEANDMMATGRGEIYEVVPLWTTPQPVPAPLSDDVVKDAARYRLLRDNWFTMYSVYERCITFKFGEPRWSDITEEELDAAIDAALAAQKGK